jgi:hypothetical protein
LSGRLALCGLLALVIALPLRLSYEPHAPLAFDLQAARHELRFARPRSELVAVAGPRSELDRSMRWARDRCRECTLLGVGSGVAALDLGPDLRKKWSDADASALVGGWTEALARTGDVGGTARVLVRQYSLRLEALGLMAPNPQGAFSPMLWADAERVRPRIYSSFDWGVGIAFAVAALLLALEVARRRRSAQGPPGAVSR